MAEGTAWRSGNRVRLGLKFSSAESLDLELPQRRGVFPPLGHARLLNAQAGRQLDLRPTGPLDGLIGRHIQAGL